MRRDGWTSASIGATAVIFVVSAVVGFILLPLAQPNLGLTGLWDAICSAAGIARKSSAKEAVAPDARLTTVVMSSALSATSMRKSLPCGTPSGP